MPGLSCPIQVSVDEVATATMQCLLHVVPAAVAGIAFLSGAQSAQPASAFLNDMHIRHGIKLPWPITFSFAYALQQPAMDIWQGRRANVLVLQQALSHRAKCNAAATLGKYNLLMERTTDY